MGTFYSPNGEKISGKKLTGGGTTEAIWAVDIAAAVGRCERSSSAKEEMSALFQKYPQLKADKWKVGEHPLSPVLDWFVKKKFGDGTQDRTVDEPGKDLNA